MNDAQKQKKGARPRYGLAPNMLSQRSTYVLRHQKCIIRIKHLLVIRPAVTGRLLVRANRGDILDVYHRGVIVVPGPEIVPRDAAIRMYPPAHMSVGIEDI